MAKNHTEVTVAEIGLCDLDNDHGLAYADASLPAYGGSWGNICKACFDFHRCTLGLGKGQRLIERDSGTR